MIRYDAGTTNPTLLNRLGDWRDHEAWVDFVTRYDPVIRSSSRRYRLDAESTEELCQRVWIDLARRMRTFRYDPGKTFRGWLRRLCQSRAIDLLRKKKADAVESLEDQPAGSLLEDASAGIEVDESAASERPRLAPPGRGSPGRRTATCQRTDVAGLLEHRHPWAVRPRDFGSRGHLLLRRLRRREAGGPDASRRRATAPGRTAGDEPEVRRTGD